MNRLTLLDPATLTSAELLQLRADGFDVPDRCNRCGETLKGVPHKGCDDVLETRR